jgi:hypothetical protein
MCDIKDTCFFILKAIITCDRPSLSTMEDEYYFTLFYFDCCYIIKYKVNEKISIYRVFGAKTYINFTEHNDIFMKNEFHITYKPTIYLMNYIMNIKYDNIIKNAEDFGKNPLNELKDFKVKNFNQTFITILLLRYGEREYFYDKDYKTKVLKVKYGKFSLLFAQGETLDLDYENDKDEEEIPLGCGYSFFVRSWFLSLHSMIPYSKMTTKSEKPKSYVDIVKGK